MGTLDWKDTSLLQAAELWWKNWWVPTLQQYTDDTISDKKANHKPYSGKM